jgi:hypothetical protein
MKGRRVRRLFAVSLAALCLLCGQAAAEEPLADASNFSVSGFGTLGYAYSSQARLGFLRDIGQNGGRPWLTDSMLGLQLAFQANSQLELISQLIARDQIKNAPAKALKWAFVGYRPGANWQLRMGRLGIDPYLQSDTRNVGYASPWVRPPVEFYGYIFFDSMDGADATYSQNFDGVHVETKLQWGQVNADYAVAGVISNYKGDDYVLLSLNTEAGPWRTRLGYSQLKNATESQLSLVPALDAVANSAARFSPEMAADAIRLRGALSFQDVITRRLSAGLVYDNGIWLAQSEVSYMWCGCIQPPSNKLSAYVFAGRRFEALMPYAMFASTRTKAVSSTTDWSALGPAAVQLQTYSLFAANRALSQQRTYSLGTRWDFNNHAALKVQWDYTTIDAGGAAMWRTPPPGAGSKEYANTLSMVLDFIF